MCLVLKSNLEQPQMAEEDIVVLKLLMWKGTKRSHKKELVTIYQKFPVEIGNTYKSELKKYDKEVSQGLHSFVSLEDIKDFCRYASREDSIIVECIIPKGSMYYVGSFSFMKSYASDTLKYVRIIT